MNTEYINIYNNLVNLSRNKTLFFYFTKKDTFSDRLLIFLFHLAFFFKYFKNKIDRKYLQDFYDYVFRQIELDIREIGYGDQSVNKKMKIYVNLLYSIINKIDDWEKYSPEKKINILNLYIEINDNNEKFLDYFEKYSNYLSKISLNSFTKSVIDHKF
ncbi:ubiquinol-cytochrome C chaperone family protein [Candidatus Pelagibacter sp.]|nr:ubiquinol-cytochrome C chaperone family protein [Candidatus Pelagibacter sp.]